MKLNTWFIILGSAIALEVVHGILYLSNFISFKQEYFIHLVSLLSMFVVGYYIIDKEGIL